MSKGPSTFRETDVKRAIRAAESAGKKVDRIEIGRDGKIVVLFPDNGETNTDDNAEVKL
jgi:hypothetical protein